jgi:hypothetical protein
MGMGMNITTCILMIEGDREAWVKELKGILGRVELSMNWRVSRSPMHTK